MTNIGIIHPDPGFHDALRELTRRTGTLLIIDETHTICAGPGGYTRAHGLAPDLLTLGKPIGGGVPGAVYGFSRGVAERLAGRIAAGGLRTPAASAARWRATRSRSPPCGPRWSRCSPRRLTRAPFRWRSGSQAGVEGVIAEFGLPWIVKRLGCRAEYWFRPDAAAERRRGGGGGRPRARPLHAPVRAQPRHPAHAVPQHGADRARPRPRPTSTGTRTVFRESVQSLVAR